MAHVSADEFDISVQEPFHIDKFRETQQVDIFEYVKRKRFFSFTAIGLIVDVA